MIILDNRRVYVFDQKKSAEKICDILFFRALLEFLYKMIDKYGLFLKTKNYETAAVKKLIEYFDGNLIGNYEELFDLKLNKNYEEETKNCRKM